MYMQNEYVAVQVNRDARDAAFQEAESLRQLRAAGLLKPSMLIRAFRASAGRLGHALIHIGQRMERIDPSTQVSPCEPA
jgi:hypothetical protein